ncbi:MAG: HAD family hydrolase [bacterium]|nr:HAD family hydrolase [bacterium]
MESGRKVVFLDRDGTINEEVNYLYRKEDLRLIEGVPQAIALLNQAGYEVIVVTNQAGVARGYYTEEDVKVLHEYLNEVLAKDHAHVDAFYYCPHHPVHGIGAYKVKCRCRKPDIGLLEQAEETGKIDREHSWMIGDKTSDTKAGIAYGIKSILVGTGYGREIYEQDCQKNQNSGYDFFKENLLKAVQWILNQESKESKKSSE